MAIFNSYVSLPEGMLMLEQNMLDVSIVDIVMC